ncbi:MAG: Water stress and hypersensitive response domain-containing protein [Burkholderiales bacterium]|nr:MAG: Water stress and hypersensitive response domain-containing protein [Burkholderiales bacterium]
MKTHPLPNAAARGRARLAALSVAVLLSACAGLPFGESVNVNVVGLDPLPGQGMEGRFLLKLRVQNPNDRPIDYDGVSIELDVRGSRLATGVSDERGSVPRFGEAVLAVPVSVPVSAMLRQALGFATGDRGRVDYRLRGRLAGTAFGAVSFSSSGELALPAGLGSTAPQ